MTITPQNDALCVAGDNYRLMFENDHVRVLEYRSQPGERTAMHSHPPSVVYAFNEATIEITVPYGEQAVYEFKPGQVMWVGESTHSSLNIGFTPAHLMMIELKDTA